MPQSLPNGQVQTMSTIDSCPLLTLKVVPVAIFQPSPSSKLWTFDNMDDIVDDQDDCGLLESCSKCNHNDVGRLGSNNAAACTMDVCIYLGFSALSETRKRKCSLTSCCCTCWESGTICDMLLLSAVGASPGLHIH